MAVDGLAWGGDGVGRAAGKVIFVPLTAPGDIADVEVVSDHGSYCRGSLRKLVRKSPLRVPPPCPVFGLCGGCQWQHVSSEAQMRAKRTILADSLTRIGKLPLPGEIDVSPSPQDYGYRHRARLQLGRSGGERVVGFFRTGSHRIVPVRRCALLQESLNALLPHLTGVLAHLPRLARATASVELAADFSGGLVRVAFRSGRKNIFPAGVVDRHLSRLAEKTGLKVFAAGAVEEPLTLSPGPLVLFAIGDTFTQVNLAHNCRLVDEVVSLAAPAKGEEVLDLYCGVGNYSIPLAARGANVLGVDTSGSSTRCAAANARRLGLAVELRRSGAASAVVAFASRGRSFDVVVLNPPRTGAKEAAAELHTLNPSRIVMISCDPATFSRDAAAIASRGYRLAALRAFDLFPQTFHFETVGLFTR